MRTVVLILFVVLVSTGIVYILYLNSWKINEKPNGFTRVFQFPVLDQSDYFDIKYDSYYIAGADSNQIYLGNIKVPMHLLVINTGLTDTQHVKLKIKEFDKLKFKAIEVLVDSSYFYMSDGTAQAILRGTKADWNARPYMLEIGYFSKLASMGPNSFAMRKLSDSGEFVLSKRMSSPRHEKLAPYLLEKQIDGIFCTDGMMHYNSDVHQLVYVYSYRNQFICVDTSMNLLYRGNTIDTISRAKIKIAKIVSENSKTIGAPPLMVNKRSCTSGNRLYVNSNLKSDNEDKATFNQSSVIDVYNLVENGKYEFSFYIPNFEGYQLMSFRVFGNLLVALHGHYLLTYQLSPLQENLLSIKLNDWDYPLADNLE